MEMQQVRYFISVAENLNFTKAAIQCNVTQPSLTRAIQALEAELGGPLFHRERGNTHLTELGRIMEPFLASTLEQTKTAKTTAADYFRLGSTPLKIGAMCTVGPAMISDLILSFRHEYPSIQIIVSDSSAKSLSEMLVSGDLNLALFGVPEPLDDRFHAMDLFEERFVIPVARHHPFADRPFVTGQDLHGENYVNRASCEYFDVIRDTLRHAGVFIKSVFSSERDDWVQGMIGAGLGFGIFPEYSVTSPDLLIKPLVDPSFTRRVQLVTMRGRPHSPTVGAFVSKARAFKWPEVKVATK